MQYIDFAEMRVPAVGLGTWQLSGRECRDTVTTALSLGYRHIDTAAAYNNEAEIGGAMRDSGLARDALWITSKVWHEDLEPDALKRSCRESLRRLGLNRLDMLLIHWPNPKVPLERSLSAMQQLVDEGLTSHIGVSNFTPEMVSEALSLAPIRCIQVECHPYLGQHVLRALAHERRLLFTAYSPLARGRVLKDPVLKEIGHRHGKSASQVALRWLIQHPGVAVIPKASSEAHLRSNLDIFDFELRLGEVQEIAQLDCGERLIDPAFAPSW